MDKLIDAVVIELVRRGFFAYTAFQLARMQALPSPVVSVGLAEARAAQRAVYTYLGMEEEADGSLRPLYGRELEADLFVVIQCPRKLGGKACMDEAEQVMLALAGPIPGVRTGGFTVGGVKFDEVTDTMQCPIRLKAKGYLYAKANAEETEFTDFILKGEVK